MSNHFEEWGDAFNATPGIELLPPESVFMLKMWFGAGWLAHKRKQKDNTDKIKAMIDSLKSAMP